MIDVIHSMIDDNNDIWMMENLANKNRRTSVLRSVENRKRKKEDLIPVNQEGNVSRLNHGQAGRIFQSCIIQD
jgi:CTP:phosphocholine cytidylyltransferase-like protein